MPLLRSHHPVPEQPALPPNDKSTMTVKRGIPKTRVLLDICSLCGEGRHQIQACPLNDSTPRTVLRRFDICACRELSREVTYLPGNIQRIVTEKFLCDYHLPKPSEPEQQQPHILDLDNQPLPDTTPVLPDTTPVLPDLPPALPDLPPALPLPPYPVEDYIPPPPLHHLDLDYPTPPPPLPCPNSSTDLDYPVPPPPLSCPTSSTADLDYPVPTPLSCPTSSTVSGPTRKRNRSKKSAEDITDRYQHIVDQLKQGQLLKDVLPSFGLKPNTGHWRRFRTTAEILIVAPNTIEDLFGSATWRDVSSHAATVAKRPDIKSALEEARSAKIIIQ